MLRTLTSGTSVDSLKKEAKAWLKAIRAGDPDAVARLARAHPKAARPAALRDIQHAIAREFFASGWQDLLDQIADIQSSDPRTRALHDLMRAAGCGDVAGVTAILDAYPDIINRRGNLPGQTGRRTPLHLAVAHEPVVRLLLDRGADPNIRDDGDNAYPLHFAAENQNLAIITLLVEHGADPIGTGDLHELEVLGWATAWDYVSVKPDIVEHLLAHGARHNIFSAIAVGDVRAVRGVIARSRIDLDRPMDRTNHRRRPLHLAVIKGQPAVLETLLELGARVNVEDSAGLTPLDQAALRGETAMAAALLDRGAEVRLPAAVALQRTDIVERLVREDPDCLHPGKRWGTLIVRAAERSSAAVIEKLLQLGASVDAFDAEGTTVDDAAHFTPLHAAATTGNVAAAEVLMKHGANPSIRESRWSATAAGWARYFKQDAVRDVILAGPIDIFEALDFNLFDRIPRIVDRDPAALNRPFRAYADLPPRADQWWPQPDTTPLAWAIQTNKPEGVRILRELGAERDR
jgi:ankyrin repeat protein